MIHETATDAVDRERRLLEEDFADPTNEDIPNPPDPRDPRLQATGSAQRDNFLKKAQRLIPGTRSGIHLLLYNDEYLTDDDAINEALTSYWENIFADPELPEERLHQIDAWIAELGPTATLPDNAPPVSAAQMELAIKHAGTSAAGHDGIPYEAYRQHPTSASILQDALQQLMDDPSTSKPPTACSGMLPRTSARASPISSPGGIFRAPSFTSRRRRTTFSKRPLR